MTWPDLNWTELNWRWSLLILPLTTAFPCAQLKNILDLGHITSSTCLLPPLHKLIFIHSFIRFCPGIWHVLATKRTSIIEGQASPAFSNFHGKLSILISQFPVCGYCNFPLNWIMCSIHCPLKFVENSWTFSSIENFTLILHSNWFVPYVLHSNIQPDSVLYYIYIYNIFGLKRNVFFVWKTESRMT